MNRIQNNIGSPDKETARIEAFSDGIFCVAITLLAIEIGVDAKHVSSNQDLARALGQLWPKYLAYFVSFINVLLAWVGHHSLFRRIRTADNFIMIANGLLLMVLALVPFPTKTLGLAMGTPAFRTAVLLYTGYFVAVSCCYRLLWFAAARHRRQLVEGITETQVRATTRAENIGLISNSTILLVALLNPWLALALSFAMWIYWIALG
ncbi:MAG TPA: TMEM175 family protein [Puia sp.]|uniref:TMEM175 family protein n=1 Tax=Puia sp. TaxID=2045100 RepID=UPI002BC36D7B|nr:TMEM175 family protein [Puia sp.]HVU94439.1 TMEM175 family protein [Puia sp.]